LKKKKNRFTGYLKFPHDKPAQNVKKKKGGGGQPGARGGLLSKQYGTCGAKTTQ